MEALQPPQKPFDNYKWRWAEFTPTEGLNQPLRFLGVLRALYKHLGERPSSESLFNDLRVVEDETREALGSSVRLARPLERNLLRGSGRYWQALGLLDSNSRASINLTHFGTRVATGLITQNEFAVGVIKTLTLPNRNIEENISDWQEADLEIKPLELILRVLINLYNNYGEKQAYLTPLELTRIVIPLAGVKSPMDKYATALIIFRKGELDLTDWADCTPEANDRRMAREFLLFLLYYGFCSIENQTGRNNDEKYILVPDYANVIEEVIARTDENSNPEETIENLRNNSVIQDVERMRVLAQVLARPQQARFRRDVLAKYRSTCLLTGENFPQVLQACHIVPVKYKGTDNVDNSFCLRVDIHLLLDTGHIRIQENGSVHFSEILQNSVTYRDLPKSIELPTFVNPKAIQWRWDYYG